MIRDDLLNLPLEIQVALGGGYLAYVLAYSGLRRGHGATDTAMISLAFGLIGVLVFRSMPGGDWARVAGGLLAMLVAAAVWRARVRALIARATAGFGVHADDGLISGWDSLIQEPGLQVTQARVVLTDGTDLFCADTGKYSDGPHRGLVLGGDGSVTMVVETEERAGGEETPRGDIRTDWGTRVTYVPADRIQRVELRCHGHHPTASGSGSDCFA
ncbi:hypothetical protein [uncultured Zoogloea sp.]|uniref:hypothetical protein n=1 Tax=uncultured Zoogloea sp. TaxID=160237 RepID=UPI00262458BD|nr:hypothetical protein [uncultured Zoogloea sp.]